MLNIILGMRTENMFNVSQFVCWQQVPANFESLTLSNNDKTNTHTLTHLLKCREAMEQVL